MEGYELGTASTEPRGGRRMSTGTSELLHSEGSASRAIGILFRRRAQDHGALAPTAVLDGGSVATRSDLTALAFIILLILVAVFARLIVIGGRRPRTRTSRTRTPSTTSACRGPSADHLFGVDQIGPRRVRPHDLRARASRCSWP
jgi:hypothetical protein